MCLLPSPTLCIHTRPSFAYLSVPERLPNGNSFSPPPPACRYESFFIPSYSEREAVMTNCPRILLFPSELLLAIVHSPTQYLIVTLPEALCLLTSQLSSFP